MPSDQIRHFASLNKVWAALSLVICFYQYKCQNWIATIKSAKFLCIVCQYAVFLDSAINKHVWGSTACDQIRYFHCFKLSWYMKSQSQRGSIQAWACEGRDRASFPLPCIHRSRLMLEIPQCSWITDLISETCINFRQQHNALPLVGVF